MRALPTIAPGPLLAAKIPPVAGPLMMAFQGSSFPLILSREQSIVEKRSPQLQSSLQ